MKSALSSTLFALLVCTCIASDLSSIDARATTSAVTIESKLDTQAGPVVSATIALPNLSVQFPTIKSEIKNQQPEPQVAPATPIEQPKKDVQPAQWPVEQVPKGIFDILIRQQGASLPDCANAGDLAFSKLIQTLSQQQLIDEKEFANIIGLDLKARFALIDKLTAAIEKLQQLSKPSGDANSAEIKIQSPLRLALQLLRRAKYILDLKIKLSSRTATQKTCGCNFGCSCKAKKAAQEARATTAAPQALTFTAPAVQIDIGSKLGRRLKKLRSLNL